MTHLALLRQEHVIESDELLCGKPFIWILLGVFYVNYKHSSF